MPLRQRFPAADITPPIQALRARFTRVRAAIDNWIMWLLMGVVAVLVTLAYLTLLMDRVRFG